MATTSNAGEPIAEAQPEIPPSKPLQVFLLIALLISGSAYVADLFSETNAPRRTRPDRLHRLVESRGEFASHMEAGMRDLKAQQYERAAEQFRLAVQAQNLAEAHYALGNALFKMARPDEALAQFKEAVRLNPHYTEVYLAWSQELIAQGKPDEAAHVLHEALRVSPNSSLAHFRLGQAYADQEKAALADQRSAEAQAHSNDAVDFGAKAERLRSDALQQFDQAQRLGLDRPEFWLAYGQLLSEEQKFAEAEPYLRKAANDQPDLTDAHFALALAQQGLGKYADAIGQYQATLTLRADDPPTLAQLALLYATATNSDFRSPKMAVQLATRANDATSAQNPRFMDTLARCHAACGDFLEAINWEDQAIHRAEQIRDLALLQQMRPRYALYLQHKTE